MVREETLQITSRLTLASRSNFSSIAVQMSVNCILLSFQLEMHIIPSPRVRAGQDKSGILAFALHHVRHLDSKMQLMSSCEIDQPIGLFVCKNWPIDWLAYFKGPIIAGVCKVGVNQVNSSWNVKTNHIFHIPKRKKFKKEADTSVLILQSLPVLSEKYCYDIIVLFLESERAMTHNNHYVTGSLGLLFIQKTLYTFFITAILDFLTSLRQRLRAIKVVLSRTTSSKNNIGAIKYLISTRLLAFFTRFLLCERGNVHKRKRKRNEGTWSKY